MKSSSLTTAVCITFLFCLLHKYSRAQRGEPGNFYVDSGIQFGRYLGFDFGANYLLEDSRYSLIVGASALATEAHNLPNDYSIGLDGALTFGLASAYERLFNFRAGMGKLFVLNPKGTFRFHPQAGLGISVIQEPTNFRRKESAFLTQNYNYDFHTHTTLSLFINPKFEILFFRFYGLSISPLLIINKDQWHYGITINTMIGRL
ncbi:MAG: hypothetical protein WBG46_03440 [Nonlabens sp.]